MWSTGTSKTTNLQLGTSLSPKTCWAGHFSRRLRHQYSFQNQKSVRHPGLLLLTHLQSVKDNRDPISSTYLMSIHLVPAFFQALVTSYLIIITSLWKTVQLSSIQPLHCQNNHPNTQIPEGLHSIQDYQQFKPGPTSLDALPYLLPCVYMNLTPFTLLRNAPWCTCMFAHAVPLTWASCLPSSPGEYILILQILGCVSPPPRNLQLG